MIRGYPASAGVVPGDSLVLHIATDAPRFRVVFYRWGEGLLRVSETDWLAGKYAPPRSAAEDWQWPSYAFPVPHDWLSGVYIAHLEEPGGNAVSLAMESAAVLFVVRGSGRSKLLYKIPLATYHAYNCTGGGCFYVNPPRSEEPPGARLSLLRPGGGIGGETWGALDYYDLSSPRQTFAHWDARFIRWLLRNGYQPEFCTDLDIHSDPDLCGRYRLMLSVGHDEYWSETIRDRTEDFVSKGGNVAFFGANLCWWRIHILHGGAAMLCHQGGPHGALDHWWPSTGVARPEDSLTGVSYRNGGGWWDGPRNTGGYIVQDPEHWVFAGTGLGRGDAFGDKTSPPLVGYECDGAPLDDFDKASGLAVLSSNAGNTGTPEGFRVLAASVLDGNWQELPPREAYPAREGIHAATMGIFSRNGAVFTAGTTDWAQVLENPLVDAITRNVIDQLLRE
ncbi:N,N-dimethylformamidase beta subunit family domain-containing protein [Nitrosospira multiformis]|uniref:N,N-dimethylformamidase beta subunit family domain-containing protein n=1 Tax=Nitrosospira multiformis TaxID=1231 RepID=UPI0008944F7A|nr:N,N-dimethylformamidase beta subunit family domain-containing protein [Nitrosospira multiformis]SEA60858.1 hypothetical protein SAMN05216411_11441 [Nitrosospira multiformis]